MAIARDVTSKHQLQNGSINSYSHTCTGSNLVLFVSITEDSNRTVNAITYNSVAMTLVDSQSNGTVKVSLYYLINPSTGSNTVSVTFSGITNSVLMSASYTGCSQVTQPDASAKVAGSSTSITVVGTGSWIIAVSDGNGSTTAGSGFQLQQSNQISVPSGSPFGILEDTNGTVSTGSNTVSVTSSATNSLVAASIRIVPVAYSLVPTAGSYTLTGVTTTLSKTYNLIVAAGSYTLTGISTVLSKVLNRWPFQTKDNSSWTDSTKNSSSFSNQSKSSSNWTDQTKS